MPRIATSDAPHRSLRPTWNRGEDEGVSPLALVRNWTEDLTHRKKESESGNVWDLSPIEESFRHGHWAARRARVYEALKGAGISARRLINFANCGATALVFVNQDNGQVELNASYCHDRFCQACGHTRAGRLQVALAARVPTARCLHVVLTLRSTDAPLKDQLDRLYKCGSKLRSRKWWKSRVAGGMASLELTRNASTGQWHPHLHCLVHADWLTQSALADEWQKVTGDSRVVHVSLVENSVAAIREVTKYVTKPVHRSIDFDHNNLVTLITALHGRHLVTTFGTWRSDPLIKDDPDAEPGNWKLWGDLHELVRKAGQGDEWCKHALAFLSSKLPGRDRVAAPGIPPSG